MKNTSKITFKIDLLNMEKEKLSTESMKVVSGGLDCGCNVLDKPSVQNENTVFFFLN